MSFGIFKKIWYKLFKRHKLNPYDTITLPMVRESYPKLIAKEIASVQPMDKITVDDLNNTFKIIENMKINRKNGR